MEVIANNEQSAFSAVKMEKLPCRPTWARGTRDLFDEAKGRRMSSMDHWQQVHVNVF